MLEKSVNQFGQEQIIDNFDKIIKIGDKFLQVRLIKTKRWKERNSRYGRFTEPMPRAKFVNPKDNPYYLIRKNDLMELKNGKR